MKNISKHFNPFGFSLLLLSMFLFAGALPVSARTHSGGGSSPSSSPSCGKTVGTCTYTAGRGPNAIAVDSSGNVWVANANSNNVTELNSSGKTVGRYYAVWGNPEGIAIDSSGNVWVANSGSRNVTELIKAAKGPQYFPYSGPRWP